MLFYQMDSSAIIKRYVREIGSARVRAIADREAGNFVGLIRITIAEVASALARKHREGDISRQERDAALEMFLGDCRTEYQIMEVDTSLVERAVQLTQLHPLRAYDAVQLAGALVLHERLVAADLPAAVFVTADERLCAIGRAEGLQAENPDVDTSPSRRQQSDVNPEG
jgi:predicted nucleic acid-binding protein